jgi:hypothetical protein
MTIKPSHSKFAPAIALALSMSALPTANAVILDLDAKVDTTQNLTLKAGTYVVEVVDDTAAGGFDGWTYASGSKIREAFDVTFPDGLTFSIDKQAGDSLKFQAYGTSAAALAAFQSGPYVVYSGDTDGTIVDVLPMLQFTLAESTELKFSTPDSRRIDNAGGVSLSITQAVPEPQSMALLLAGLCIVAASRRRRHASDRP